MSKSIVTYDQFTAVDIRVGTVVRCEINEKARKPALKLWVDFGEAIGTLQSSAQITAHYAPESLVGKQVLGCINLGERNIAGFVSQCLTLGIHDANGEVVLVMPQKPVPDGEKLL